jgi:hypothetical protein
MAIALVNHLAAKGSTPNLTTQPIDTTGANLIVAFVTYFSTSTTSQFSDSLGNSWGTPYQIGLVSDGSFALFFLLNPTVGSAQTFTVTGNADAINGVSIVVAAFSGVSAFDDQMGTLPDAAAGNGTTIQISPPYTPSDSNALIVEGVGWDQTGGTVTVDSGLLITDQVDYASAGPSDGLAMAFLIQGQAAPVQPTWTRTNNDYFGAIILIFLATPGPSPGNLLGQAML